MSIDDDSYNDELEPSCAAWVVLPSALVVAALILLCVGTFLWGWRWP